MGRMSCDTREDVGEPGLWIAVEDIARGVCRLSMTIRSFSSSDQRRRRPVSMTSSRSTLVLCLWQSISTVTHHSTKPNKAALAEGRPLFAGFAGTIDESDFFVPFIIGYGLRPSRCGPGDGFPRTKRRSPGSRTRDVRTCLGSKDDAGWPRSSR
jgi:hypothetical protein